MEGGPVLSPLALYVFEQEMLPCLSNRLTMSLIKVIRGDGGPSGSAQRRDSDLERGVA